MPTFERSIEIHAERGALFALTQDYSRRLEWDPFLRKASLVGGATTVAVGIRVWCVTKLGIGMETEYVRLEPPEVVAVGMTRGPILLSAFAASWRFEELAPDLTRVVWRYHLRLRPRLLRPLLTPLVVALFSREMARRLEALKRVAEAAIAV